MENKNDDKGQTKITESNFSMGAFWGPLFDGTAYTIFEIARRGEVLYGFGLDISASDNVDKKKKKN